MKSFKVNKNETLLRIGFWSLLILIVEVILIVEQVNIFIPLGISIVGLGSLWAFWSSASRRAVVIEEDRIIINDGFASEVYGFRDIKGYHLVNRNIRLILHKDIWNNPTIGDDYEDQDELILRFAKSFPNLDLNISQENIYDEKKAYDVFIHDPKFGNSIEERIGKLKTAKRIGVVLHIITGVLIFFMLMPFISIEFILPLALLYLISCYIIMIRSNGLINIINYDSLNLPLIFHDLFFTILLLLIRINSSFDLVDLAPVFILTFIISLIFILANAYAHKPKIFSLNAILSSICIPFFIYSLIITANCVFDKGTIKLYNYAIIKKDYSTGKSNSYYFYLESQPNKPAVKSISVSQNDYETLNEGDRITLKFRNGRLNIPYFF